MTHNAKMIRPNEFALSASMFGSMFPMPRIAYAMAKDGLIFRFFSSINSRGVPACANFWLSLTAAFCALYFSLEVLVEMMSIGTLLAYTLGTIHKLREIHWETCDQLHK